MLLLLSIIIPSSYTIYILVVPPAPRSSCPLTHTLSPLTPPTLPVSPSHPAVWIKPLVQEPSLCQQPYFENPDQAEEAFLTAEQAAGP